MRILLIQPDYARSDRSKDRLAARLLPARSLLELAAILEDRGHDVMVLDPVTAVAATDEPALDLEAALAAILDEHSFDAVGIAIYTATRKEARRLAATVKRHSPRTKVIAGGPHASHLAQGIMTAWREIDFVCLGAAEDSLPALLDSISGKGPAFRVRNIAFRTSTGVIRLTGKPSYQANLAELPGPRYRKYLDSAPDGRIRRAYVLTARGCRHWCNFCSQLWKKVLPAPPEAVAAEVETLVNDCGAEEIIFYDDCFGSNPAHARAVLEQIIAARLKVRLQAVTRFDTVSEEWLGPFREAGGVDVLAGLESGSPKLRRRMNKHLAEDDLCRGSELIRGFGLRLGVFLMFGFPNEDDRDARETWRLLKLMEPAQVMSTVFDIKPGDLLFEFAVSFQADSRDAWLSDLPRSVNGMGPDDLRAAAARAMAFDRAFTREVILPEHDPAAFAHGLDPQSLEAAIAEEIAKWS